MAQTIAALLQYTLIVRNCKKFGIDFTSTTQTMHVGWLHGCTFFPFWLRSAVYLFTKYQLQLLCV